MAKFRVMVEQSYYEYYEIETDLTDRKDIESFFRDQLDEGLGYIDELTESSDTFGGYGDICKIEKIGD